MSAHGENLEGVVVRGLEAELPGHVVVADGWGGWVSRGRWFQGGKVGRGGEVVVFVHREGASRGVAGGVEGAWTGRGGLELDKLWRREMLEAFGGVVGAGADELGNVAIPEA